MRSTKGSSLTSMRRAGLAWRELRRPGHRCCVGDSSQAPARVDARQHRRQVVGDHVRNGGRIDFVDNPSRLGCPATGGPGRVAPPRDPDPYDEAVAATWGWLDARAQARGRPRPINDMWIAACCLVEDVPLATLNRKDFEDFAEHDGLRLI